MRRSLLQRGTVREEIARRFCVGLWLLASGLGPAEEAAAQAGALDPSFGVGGLAISDLDGPFETAWSVLVQGDGKILSAGRLTGADDYDVAVVRYLANGLPDPDFGDSGVVTFDVAGSRDYASDLALEADGRVVVGGYARMPADFDFLVARLDGDGELDDGFGAGGIVTTPIVALDEATSVAVQPDGRIVAFGSASDVDGVRPALVRYETDGQPDTTFGDQGVALIDPTNGSDFASGFALLPDGRMVVGAYTVLGATVVRLLADGTVDETFGTDGVAAVALDGFLRGLAVEASGRIVVAVQIDSGGPEPEQRQIGLVRFRADGSPDPAFGTGGKVEIDRGSWDDPLDLVVQADRRILVAGRIDGSAFSPKRGAVLRFTEAGALDPAFGVGGVAYVDVADEKTELHAVAIQPDQRIVATGTVTAAPSEAFLTVRLLNDLVFADGFETGSLVAWCTGSEP